MPDAGAVLESALSLSVEERAEIAEKLLASLDDVNEQEAEQLWAAEAQRRLDGHRAGRDRTVSAAEVADKARRLFK